MNKTIKYMLWLVALLFVAYNSVYFKKLDEVKSGAVKAFDAVGYADVYFYKKLPPVAAHAPEIDELILMIKKNTADAFKSNGYALAIGNARYFLVKGEGKVTDVDENGVTVQTTSGHTVLLATEYVFGNAVRDASGLVNINEFSNTLDLNNISAETNKIIRDKVLPVFKSQVKKGSKVKFIGAIGLNEAHLQLDDIEVTPISLKITQ